MLQVHWMLCDVLNELRGHIRLHVRNVKPKILRQEIGFVVYDSFEERENTFQCLQPVIHLHFVGSIVDVVGMEQGIQGRSAVHEIARHYNNRKERRFHVLTKRTTQFLRYTVNPCLQRNRYLNSLTIPSSTYISRSLIKLDLPLVQSSQKVALVSGNTHPPMLSSFSPAEYKSSHSPVS